MTRLESRAEVPPACGYYALDDINKQTCELFVPIKSLDAYKAADQWKDFVFITGVDYDNPGSVEDAVSENDGVHVVANNDSIEVTGADNAVKTVYNINGQVIYRTPQSVCRRMASTSCAWQGKRSRWLYSAHRLLRIKRHLRLFCIGCCSFL